MRNPVPREDFEQSGKTGGTNHPRRPNYLIWVAVGILITALIVALL